MVYVLVVLNIIRCKHHNWNSDFRAILRIKNYVILFRERERERERETSCFKFEIITSENVRDDVLVHRPM